MIVSLIAFRYHVQCAVSHATQELAKYHAKASLFAVLIAFCAKMGTTQTVVVSDFQLNLQSFPVDINVDLQQTLMRYSE